MTALFLADKRASDSIEFFIRWYRGETYAEMGRMENKSGEEIRRRCIYGKGKLIERNTGVRINKNQEAFDMLSARYAAIKK